MYKKRELSFLQGKPVLGLRFQNFAEMASAVLALALNYRLEI